jgi:hypothetical protein
MFQTPNNVLLTVYHSTVYQYNETNVMHFSFSLLRIQEALHVLSIICPSSGGAKQAALGILCACYVSWLHQDFNPGAAN